MKKILVISSASIHTKKFIDMIQGHFEIYLITNNIDIFQDCEIEKIYQWNKNPIKNAWITKQILKKINPDLIHIQQVGFLAFYYTLLLHRHYKILVTAWGGDIMEFPYINKLKYWMTTYTLKHVSILSSINSVGMMSVMHSLTDFKRQIIPINFGVGKYISFEHIYFNKENIIYSPRAHEDLYNIEIILHSFASFIQKESQWKLYLSGSSDPKNTPKLKALSKELGLETSVNFVGALSQEEHAKLLNRSKIVVSVPITDGRPISVMEAIASNCTVICSNILANQELISDGINGVLIDHTKIFDFGVYHQIDINLQTNYNEAISKSFSYVNAQKSFIHTMERILYDDNYR